MKRTRLEYLTRRRGDRGDCARQFSASCASPREPHGERLQAEELRAEEQRAFNRQGAALVAALALLALSAALVSGTFAVGRALQMRTRAESSRLVAESAAMRALVLLTAGWGPRENALAPGASLERDLAETLAAPPDARPAVRGRTRISRLTDRGYLVAVDVRVGDAPVLARRRMQLLLVRPLPDSASVARGEPRPAPRPVTSWTLADLY